MTSSPRSTATTRTVVALALGGLTLLTGCQAAGNQTGAQGTSVAPVVPAVVPAVVPTVASSSASPPTALPAPSAESVARASVAPVPTAKAPAGTPVRSSAAKAGCPDGATLFALLPAGEKAGTRPARGPATCAGDWAVIGVLHQGGQSVALFSSATGRWRPADAARACAGHVLPTALVDGVCNAG